MQSFPMFLKMAGRRVVIAGGGEQAAQKLRLMLKTEAALSLLAPTLDEELAGAVARGRVSHHSGPVTGAEFAGAALVFVATGCPGADACLHAIAKSAGALVNVVDQPALCDATTPSIVDRDPLVVAVGTEGTAPVLARSVKTRIEQMLDPGLGRFAALAGRLRPHVAAHISREQRRSFWRWVFAGAPWQAFRAGAEGASEAMIRAFIVKGRSGDATAGRITVIGVPRGGSNLLTLRAVARLQEADVICVQSPAGQGALELARRDAERIFLTGGQGVLPWPQKKVYDQIAAQARKGRHVVILTDEAPGHDARGVRALTPLCPPQMVIERLLPGAGQSDEANGESQSPAWRRKSAATAR